MKKLLFLFVGLPFTVLGQTTSQNFVKTTTYKVATTVIAEPNENQKNVGVTYLDGLGRPIQQIAHKQSGTGKDIITHIEYDKLGRPVKEYLPYAKCYGTSDMSFLGAGHDETLYYYSSTNSAETGNPNFETTTNPYSEKLYESSALNRVLKQGAPGNAWALSGNSNADHSVKFEYQINSVADQVKLYKAVSSSSGNPVVYTIGFSQTGTANYPAGQLYKTVTRDENWTGGTNHTTEEFKDQEGKVLLKRTYGVSVVNNVATNTRHDTYYVYDQYGNLTYVLPPLTANVPADLNGLCYQYKYDYRNRLIEKKLPGKQWEYIIYDKLDRVVATGPALSPFTDAPANTYGWMVTKYDVFNRPVYTGWQEESTAFSGSLRTTKQTAVTGLTALNETKVANFTVDFVNIRYTNNVALFSTAFKLLTVNYYDDYNFSGAPTFPVSVDGETAYYTNTTYKPKGLATGSWVRIVEAFSAPIRAEVSYTLYDSKARPIRNHTTNYLLGFTQVDTKYDFVKTLHTVTTHKRLASSTVVTIKDEFTYTNQDRILTHTHQINGGTKQLLAKNEYDELGQLITKRVGNTDLTGVGAYQKVDYKYNVRGWLTGINKADGSVNPLQQDSDPLDLFAFKINYDSVEGGVVGIQPLYNGNISETYWRTGNDNILRKYGYAYDQMNRLNDAIYQKSGLSTPTNSYNESVTYDKNGNIKTLQRNGDLDSNTFTIEMDDLVYTYSTTQPNQLTAVEDLSNHPQGFKDGTNAGIDFTYDSNGNMITDQNKEILSIKYNHLNLPTQIVFSGTNKKINYLYTAAGVKVEKKVTNGSTVTTTDYLSGFQYVKINSGAVVMDFFPHAEGYVACTLSGFTPVFNYVFNYTDHLGNIRVSYSWDTTAGSLTILEENHYFPFGLKHTKYNRETWNYVSTPEGGYNTGSLVRADNNRKNYQYKYNGKEFQDELGLNFYDYGARNYDAAIGRWMNIDPLAELSRRYSPYTYALDNPVYFIDPDGMLSQSFVTQMQSTGTNDYNRKMGEVQTSESADTGEKEKEKKKTTKSNTVDGGRVKSKGNGENINYFDPNDKVHIGLYLTAENQIVEEGVLKIFTHGNTDITCGYQTVEDIEAVLYRDSAVWRNFVDNGGELTIILYSCLTANKFADGSNTPIAEEFAVYNLEKGRNLHVIAPTSNISGDYDRKRFFVHNGGHWVKYVKENVSNSTTKKQ